MRYLLGGDPRDFEHPRGAAAARCWPSNSSTPAGRPRTRPWSPPVSAACHRQGLITLTCGTLGNVLRFLPALVIGTDLLTEGLDILEHAFASCA